MDRPIQLENFAFVGPEWTDEVLAALYALLPGGDEDVALIVTWVKHLLAPTRWRSPPPLPPYLAAWLPATATEEVLEHMVMQINFATLKDTVQELAEANGLS